MVKEYFWQDVCRTHSSPGSGSTSRNAGEQRLFRQLPSALPVATASHRTAITLQTTLILTNLDCVTCLLPAFYSTVYVRLRMVLCGTTGPTPLIEWTLTVAMGYFMGNILNSCLCLVWFLGAAAEVWGKTPWDV